MKIEHIAERLERIAAHRTPGRPAPPFPIPIGEHSLLYEAAWWLRVLQADLNGLRHTNSQASNHQRWALVDDSTNTIIGFCNGDKEQAQAMVQERIDTHQPRARSIVIRAIYLGED